MTFQRSYEISLAEVRNYVCSNELFHLNRNPHLSIFIHSHSLDQTRDLKNDGRPGKAGPYGSKVYIFLVASMQLFNKVLATSWRGIRIGLSLRKDGQHLARLA